ncbi:MAG: tryptophan halogenase [Sphingomonas sp.]|nr:tryptophan halogenase [Sphingomonas sp.]
MDDGKGKPDHINKVTVVGGGTAGWLAACRIAAEARRTGREIRLCLVESDRVPPIGVGEGTWPTMRNTLAKIGVSETDFVRECDATFKQGARFTGWADGSPGDSYYHPLNPPAGATRIDLARFWPGEGGGVSFAGWIDFQAALCDAGLAPKAITSAEYQGQANYAYHLDAGKFAAFLKEHATSRLGVEHIVGDVADAVLDDSGDIGHLTLSDGRSVTGDLFIDCTGFAALLIGKVYAVPFRSCRDILFADRAIAMQVPYAQDDAPIASQTISTATGAGWIWDIGLWARRGVGHVYSSAHCDDERAEKMLRDYIGPAAKGLTSRRIDIDAGYRTRFWQNNCVAVGLSAGFLEPLEASALMLVETSLDAIAERLPQNRQAMCIAARQFNTTFLHHWARIIEFLKLHYGITRRRDTDFWRDNADPASFPDELAERLEFWRHHSPNAQDFTHAREVFGWPSYQYVLNGMGFAADRSSLGDGSPNAAVARGLLEQLDRLRSEALARLPAHRDLIRAIREHGLQRI